MMRLMQQLPPERGAEPGHALVLAELGLENGRTLLQSGNLVFSSDAASGALEKLLEREAKRRLGSTNSRSGATVH